MPLRLSSHARHQAQRRGIPEDVLLSVAREPEQVLWVSANREIRQSRIVFLGRDEPYLVRVVVDRLADDELIVTCYRTSRLAKYWSNR
jgi:hypothetical protein